MAITQRDVMRSQRGASPCAGARSGGCYAFYCKRFGGSAAHREICYELVEMRSVSFHKQNGVFTVAFENKYYLFFINMSRLKILRCR